MNDAEIAAARETASNDPISDATDLTGHAPQGAGAQNPLSHSNSGNSGGSKTTKNVNSGYEQSGPGRPNPSNK